jgi:hypothetical protein
MDAARHQRVMVRDDHHPSPRADERRTHRIDDLRFGIGGAVGIGMLRLGSGVEPPLRIQQYEAETCSYVNYRRPWTAAAWLE